MKKFASSALKHFLCLFLFFSLGQAALAADTPEGASVDQIKQAAEAGDPDAEYALGYMYYYGREVPQDTNQAKKWIKKAAAQGQQQAMKAEKILLGSSQPATTKKPEVTQSQPKPQKQAPVVKKAPPAAPTKQAAPAVASTQPKAPAQRQPVSQQPKQTATYQQPKAKPRPQPRRVAQQPAPNRMQGKYFTIQVIAGGNKNNIMNFINSSPLNNLSYYTTTRNGQNWYVVTYGRFPSRQAAKNAIYDLPNSVQSLGPWVKSSAMIEQERQR